MNQRATDILASVALVAAVVLLYRKITRLWWTWDDAYLLHIAIVHPARDHFIGSSIWQTMPQHLFTPLLTASYDSELSLFGLNSAAFYRMHLALVAVVAVALFWAGRLWLSSGAAFTSSLLTILGAPFGVLATELMLVHYLESILLAACATGLFVLGLRSNRSVLLSIASAGLYLAAMLAKEIAVPLIAVLPLAGERQLRDRLLLIPHALALALYGFWRYRALGELIGGYGWTIRGNEFLGVLTAFPRAVLAQLSAGSAVAIALLIVVSCGIIMMIRGTRDAAIVIFVLALAIAPMIPMAKKIEPRFVTMLWLASAMFACAGYGKLRDRRIRVPAFVLLIALALVVNRSAWAADFRLSLRMSDEARVFFDLGDGDALRKPAVPPAAMSELRWLKEEYLHRQRGAGWFYDDLFLCRANLPRRVFSYVPERRTVMEAAGIDRLGAEYCRSIRESAPLTASFHHEGESLFWRFGPYDRGEYGIVIDDGVEAFAVPRDDGFRLPRLNSLALRVRYQSPDHWVTYSPDLKLDFVRRPDFEWRR